LQDSGKCNNQLSELGQLQTPKDIAFLRGS